MAYDQLIFRLHAIRRIFERNIDEQDIRYVLETGEVIAVYSDDLPYPSYLVLGYCGARPVHVVAADNHEGRQTIIITVYEPNPAQWDPTFRRRNTQ